MNSSTYSYDEQPKVEREYLANSAVIPRRQGNEGAAIAKNAIPNP